MGMSAAKPVAAAEPEFDIEAATQRYLGRLDADAMAKSDAYFEGGYWIIIWNLIYSLAMAWLLLGMGLSHKMRAWSERAGSRVFVQNMVYVAQYTLLTTLLYFPLMVYTEFFREHSYGLSNLSFGGWFSEMAIGLVVDLIIFSILTALVYKIVRKLIDSWHLWASVVSIAFLALFLLISPVYISPLFNDFTSLEEGALRTEILSLARANSIPADDVYLMDSSRQSKRISANVSGLGHTTRISLNDNLVNRSDLAGVKAVMGHEMGHYALNHIYRFLMTLSIILVVGFIFVRWSFDRVNRSAWQISSIGDIAGFPLVMAIFSVYFFLATPVVNTMIRSAEVEADLYGLNASREPDGFAETILSLSEYRKLKPGYWEEFFLFDHPSGYNRIKMAMQWKKENPGVGADSIAIIPEKDAN